MKINKINNTVNTLTFNSRNRMDQKNRICNHDLIPFQQDYSDSRQTVTFDNTKFQLLQSDDGISFNDRTYDSFTGLRDKNYLLAALDKRIKSAQFSNRPLSIAMFDMDNFKSVNELLGYEDGDNFIKSISKTISETAKKSSLPTYRFGGDEFVIIFDRQTPKEQEQLVDTIVGNILNNSYINSKSVEYISNAGEKLLEYNSSTKHINQIMALSTEKKILEDLQSNLTTEEARNDSYLADRISKANDEIRLAYLFMVSNRVRNEEDEDTKTWLKETQKELLNDKQLSKKKEKSLDEYLRSVYDKTPEIHQIKKWMSDFKKNNGFNISGSCVTFKPEDLKDRTPISLINEVGEELKYNKHNKKQSYSECV